MGRRRCRRKRHFLSIPFFVAIAFTLGSCTGGGGSSTPRPTPPSEPFVSTINTGKKLSAILASIESHRAPAYIPEARAYVARYPANAVDDAKAAHYPSALIKNLKQGFIVLYERNPHLGRDRVPFCTSSHWFEDPVDGAKFNSVGEKRAGPAARGMTRFRGVVATDGTLSIDTSTEYPGERLGTDTTGDKPAGAPCV